MTIQYCLYNAPIREIRVLHGFTARFAELVNVICGPAHSALVAKMYLNHEISIVQDVLHYLVWVQLSFRELYYGLENECRVHSKPAKQPVLPTT